MTLEGGKSLSEPSSLNVKKYFKEKIGKFNYFGKTGNNARFDPRRRIYRP
jgi:hypothetical protein